MKDAGAGDRTRSPAFIWTLTALAALLFAGFCALGIWQVQRLAWKEDLIARVDARIHATPAPAPAIATKADEYRRVRVSGTFLHDRAVLVQASTILGPGYWVLTPLSLDDGTLVIVNRGYIPGRQARFARPAGSNAVVGLVRLTEPGGGFLRSNDPAAGRWYSRDIGTIANAKGLRGVRATYFIDAQGGATPRGTLPVPGLTVVTFPNNHLQYAITWFALAGMTILAYIIVMRHPGKDHRA